MDNNEPVTRNAPIDFEIAEMLGVRAMDFVVLVADGREVDFFGTPVDSPENRDLYQSLCDDLNSSDPEWRRFFLDWIREWIRWAQLDHADFDRFRPRFSIAIRRVLPGYSSHLNVAMGLFKTVGGRADCWAVGKTPEGGAWAEISSAASGIRHMSESNTADEATIASLVATVCRDLLSEARQDS